MPDLSRIACCVILAIYWCLFSLWSASVSSAEYKTCKRTPVLGMRNLKTSWVFDKTSLKRCKNAPFSLSISPVSTVSHTAQGVLLEWKCSAMAMTLILSPALIESPNSCNFKTNWLTSACTCGSSYKYKARACSECLILSAALGLSRFSYSGWCPCFFSVTPKNRNPWSYRILSFS